MKLINKIIILVLLLSFVIFITRCSSKLSYTTKIYVNNIEIQSVKTCNYPNIHYYLWSMVIYDVCPCTSNIVFSMPYDQSKNIYRVEIINKVIESE